MRPMDSWQGLGSDGLGRWTMTQRWPVSVGRVARWSSGHPVELELDTLSGDRFGLQHDEAFFVSCHFVAVFG